jgi:hypothetical protein
LLWGGAPPPPRNYVSRAYFFTSLACTWAESCAER